MKDRPLFVATQPMNHPLDTEKPEVKPGQLLCDGCWAVSDSLGGWMTFRFKYLAQTNLCPKCAPEMGSHCATLQENGL